MLAKGAEVNWTQLVAQKPGTPMQEPPPRGTRQHEGPPRILQRGRVDKKEFGSLALERGGDVVLERVEEPVQTFAFHDPVARADQPELPGTGSLDLLGQLCFGLGGRSDLRPPSRQS